MIGDAIDARTALAWRFVNRVVPRAELEKAAEALALATSRGSLASARADLSCPAHDGGAGSPAHPIVRAQSSSRKLTRP